MVHLPYLAEVAHHKSFTKAADSLHLTQAAVSYQIRQLEDKLGTTLVKRQKGGKTSLTSSGVSLVKEYNWCAKKLRLSLDAIDFRNSSGVLRLTCPVDFGAIIMPKVIAQLKHVAPGLRIQCHTSDDVVDIETSDWDLSISSSKCTQGIDNQALFKSPLCIVSSPEYLRNAPALFQISDLPEHSIISRESSENLSWRSLVALGGVKYSAISSSVALGNTLAMIRGAEEGLGLAIVPKFCVIKEIESNKLVQVLEKHTSRLAVHFQLKKIDTPQTNYFSSLIEEVFRSNTFE